MKLLLEKIQLRLIKKESGFIDYATLFLGVIFFLQTIWIIYQTLFFSKYYLNYDGSGNLLFDLVVAKSGSLYPREFYRTTTQFYAPLEALIFTVCGNLFIAHGVGNIIHIGVILYFTYRIVRIVVEPENLLFCFFMTCVFMLCPFVNPSHSIYLNYADVMSYPLAFFVGYAMMGVFIIWMYLLFEGEEKIELKDMVIIGVGTILLLLRLIASYEFISVTVVAPIIICTLFKVVKKNDWKAFFSKQAKFAYYITGVIGISIVLNKLLIPFDDVTEGMKWTKVSDIFESMFKVVAGFLDIASALPQSDKCNVFSIWSVEYAVGLIIVMMIAWAIGVAVHGIIKNDCMYLKMLIFVCIIVFNVVFYSLVNTDYSGVGFSARYILIAFICCFFLVPVALSNLSDKLIIKKLGIVVVIGALVVMTVMSDIARFQKRNDVTRLETIEAIIDEVGNGSKLVYIVGGENIWDAKYMRCWDTERVYKDIWANGELWHWGDYSYFEEAAEYQGPYLIFCNKDNYDTLPAYVQNDVNRIGEWDIYDIYYGEGTEYDFSTRYDQEINYDFPYSPSVTTFHMDETEYGEYVSDGSEDIILCGPNHVFEKGIYDVMLEYELVDAGDNDIVGVFDLVKNEQEVLDSIQISNVEDGKIGFENIPFDGNTWIQYRLAESKGVRIKIKKVVVKKGK